MVKRLGFVEVSSTRVEDWVDFVGLLGASASVADDGAVAVRLDERPYRLRVRPGEVDDLTAIGWDVDNESFGQLEVALAERGLALHEDDALAATRHADAAAWTIDPWGFRHEFLVNIAETEVPRELDGRFVTGTQGMGHLVLMVPSLEQADDFVTGVLGLLLSDTVDVGSGLRFYHCAGSASRHHSVAFSQVPGRRGLHHIMVEVADLDEVGLALDRVRDAGHALAMDYGRHPNDEMTSFYVRTPSGFELEFGAGGLVIDDGTWEVTSFDAMSIWGHRPPVDGPLRPGVMTKIDTTA